MNNELLKDIEQITAKYADNEQELQKQLLDYLVDLKLKSKKIKSAFPISELVQDELQRVKNAPEQNDIFYSFFINLDVELGCFQFGELVTLASRPGAGLSTLMASLAINISREYPVLYFSLNQSLQEITRVLLSASSEIEFRNTKRVFDQSRLHLLTKAAEEIKDHHLYVNANSSISLENFIIHITKEIEEKNIRVIFVDYLQMFSSDTTRNQRDLEISNACRELKKIAVNYNVGVIMGSQLSRNVEYRINKIPRMYDLRDSGGIEEVSDKVILLYNPSYYQIEQDEDDNDISDIIELHIVKNNSGKTDIVTLKKNKNFTAIKNFYDYSESLDIKKDRFYEVNEKDSDF